MSRRIVRLLTAMAFGALLSAPLATFGNADGAQIAARSQITDRGVQVATRGLISGTGVQVATRGLISGTGARTLRA